jgi:hypothetical protein
MVVIPVMAVALEVSAAPTARLPEVIDNAGVDDPVCSAPETNEDVAETPLNWETMAVRAAQLDGTFTVTEVTELVREHQQMARPSPPPSLFAGGLVEGYVVGKCQVLEPLLSVTELIGTVADPLEGITLTTRNVPAPALIDTVTDVAVLTRVDCS